MVGVGVHAPSRPEVTVYSPRPVSWVLAQPRPISLIFAASGASPTASAGPFPCILPKVWPPTVSATVSRSFIAMRPKVSRTSWADFIASGMPLGPSGLT